jgi:hypothetical protein
MPSPFPGMNPYLEQEDVWVDFHQSLIPLLRDMLAAQIRPVYLARVEEYLVIHELPEDEQRYLGRADLSVTRSPTGARSQSAGATLEAPMYGRWSPTVDIERHSYLEIRDRHDRHLVTVIEVLSPSNKRTGPDREQYLAKRRQIYASNVHLVEIDLLRGGPRLPLDTPPDCDYCVLVSRAEERPEIGIWPLRLRDKLPEIPIPLRAPDTDARLDLQGALNRLYDAAGYEDYIYTGSPQPPLHPEDAAWARQFLPTLPPLGTAS